MALTVTLSRLLCAHLDPGLARSILDASTENQGQRPYAVLLHGVTACDPLPPPAMYAATHPRRMLQRPLSVCCNPVRRRPAHRRTAIQEDGRTSCQRGTKELSKDVQEGDAHVAVEHGSWADGTGRVQGGAGVGATCYMHV